LTKQEIQSTRKKYYDESLKRTDSVLDNMDRSKQKYDDALMGKGIILIFLEQQQKGNEILKNLYDKQKDSLRKEMYSQFLNKFRQEILESIFSGNVTSTAAEPTIKD